jgi:hypothetical protein
MEAQPKMIIGFILLTHEKPHQALRLIRRLNELYAFPPIVCHHDFSQSDFPQNQAPGNLSFVRPHVRTRWGDFSLVEATLRAMRRMLDRPDGPDWFVLLSGADYPIKPAWKVRDDFQQAGCDAHLDHTLIDPARCDNAWKLAYRSRYFCLPVSVPGWTKTRGFHWRTLKLPHRLSSWFLPFSRDFPCSAGSQWFNLNRRAAEYILAQTQANPRVYRHFGVTNFPDEAYFQTTLANARFLSLHPNHFRYIDWSSDGPKPKTLDLTDLPKLIASPAHFARKFSLDRVDLLDALDRAVDEMSDPKIPEG